MNKDDIMERSIKYRRFEEFLNTASNTSDESSLQIFLDKLVTEGWNIIYYNEEKTDPNHKDELHVVILANKRQNSII